mgnify:CR=1 FL=1
METKGRINPLHIRFNVPDSEKEDEKIPLSEIKPLSSHNTFFTLFSLIPIKVKVENVILYST